MGVVAADVRPGDLKDRAHAHPGGPAAEGVAAGGGEQHRVHVERGGRAENGADVGAVHDPLQHGDPAGVGAQGFHLCLPGTAHGAQDSPREGVAGQLGQHLPVGGIHRDLGTALQKFLSLSGEMAPLHKEGEGLTPAVQGPPDDLGALRNEDALLRLQPVAQLGLGEVGKDRQFRCTEIGYLDNMGHRGSPSPLSRPGR